ncbi:hypothetical protein BKA56DRAFT_580906 [Ilyonectria sp. MPI-CAGE-AT-0026]|nr:hypothetical protein BKA56DRAFT_580906 [Ilyonectria sp. MPI-CAGE-AT-0026]
MASHKKFLKEIADANSAVTAEIGELVAKIDNRTEENASTATKSILCKLHDSLIRICEHRGHPRTPNKTILDAYHSFLEPITTLCKLPSGDFITARMIVYLAEAISSEGALDKKFIKSKARTTTVPLYELCTALDDALLEPLRRMWAASNKNEDFCWVFGDYTLLYHHSPGLPNVQEEMARRSELAQALTPTELATLGGIKDRSYLFSKNVKKQNWLPLPNDPRDLSPDMSNTEKLVFKQLAPDGPIRNGMEFHTIDTDQNDHDTWRHIDILRRSRQFILDAHHITAPISTDKSYRLAKRALAEAGFPPEILMYIFRYLDPPKVHPYLRQVDIASAYVPFPESTGLCAECKSRKTGAANRRLKFTCPGASIYLWSLSLRAFHVFHQHTATSWRLCRHGLDCEGHHDDGSWEINADDQVVELAEAIIAGRCGTPRTLEQVGLGQDPNCKLTRREDDEERQKKLFPRWPQLKDFKNESEMSGGVGGLVDTMMHQRLLVGAWDSGHVVTDPSWSWSRNMVDKKRAEDAIGSIHSRCDLC